MSKLLIFSSILILFFGTMKVEGQVFCNDKKFISTCSGQPTSVNSADLDGDGYIDLVVGFLFEEIAWYRNEGDESFSDEITISNIDIPVNPSLIDFDGDGDIDILSGSYGRNEIVWYKNDGNGEFEEISFLVDIDDLKDIHTADLDYDGDLDVISASTADEGNKIAWYENDGEGNLGNQIIIYFSDTSFNPCSVSAADLDGDSHVDILSTSREGDKVVWYRNDGNGGFSSQITISKVGFGEWSRVFVYVSDLDNDGDTDVVWSSKSIYTIIWHENDGNGNFSSENFISTNDDNPVIFTDVDINGDNYMDLLYSTYSTDKIAWYENEQNGNFSSVNIIDTVDSNPFLQGCIGIADVNGDGALDILSASGNERKIYWYKNLYNNPKITSLTFQDTNENGLHDNSEPPLINRPIFLQPSADATFTNYEGYTLFSVQNGNYQISTEPTTLWELTTPKTYSITANGNSEFPTYFGFKPTRILPRVEPNLNSSPTRCSTTANYWLNYSNTGTTIANGTITLETDELMGFISANPEPDNIEGNTLTWHFEELLPSFENQIVLQFQMPNFNSMGEILETQATVQLFNDNQEIVSSKTTNYDSEVLCSYDPNDKLARSNLLGQSEFAYIQDTILYTVRFQNTGNDTAFNIRIEDVLDKKLDWTTFHPITSSHDYRTELNRETGLVTFYFDDILLPDSTTNEPESHGFVMFGIASLENLEDKTEVDNTASIFFDFNPPIITNTATLTLLRGEVGIDGIDNSYSILVRPNPFSDYTIIEVDGLSQGGNYLLEVRDILGRKIEELKVENGKVNLERGDLGSGLYLIQVLKEETNKILGSAKVLVE